jgi:hypothetical protein
MVNNTYTRLTNKMSIQTYRKSRDCRRQKFHSIKQYYIKQLYNKQTNKLHMLKYKTLLHISAVVFSHYMFYHLHMTKLYNNSVYAFNNSYSLKMSKGNGRNMSECFRVLIRVIVRYKRVLYLSIARKFYNIKYGKLQFSAKNY